MTATYIIPSKLEDETLYSIFHTAIVGLVTRHPALCCYVEAEATSDPKFRRLERFNLKDVVQIQDLGEQESLEQKLQDIHDQRWPSENKPLWKLVIMRELQRASIGSRLHIALVYSHAIGDGLSGLAFHRTLLQELIKAPQLNQQAKDHLKAIDIPVDTKMIEPVEKLTPLPLSKLFLIKQVANEYLPRWLIGGPPPIWAGLPIQNLVECPYRSRIRIVYIESAELNWLLEESRKHGVTLTSLLTAAIVFALALAVVDASSFIGDTPYTLRRVTGTSMEEMVNETSTLQTTYATKLLDRIRNAPNSTEHVEGFWDTAQFFHAQMQDEIARCPKDNLVGLLPYLLNHVQYYQKKFGRARETSWELSNVGVFKTTALPKGWKLERMIFSQGAQPVGAAFSINSVSVSGGPLNITITWQDSVVEERVIDALAQAFTELPQFLQRGK